MATEAQIAVVMLYLGLLFGKLSLPSNGPAKLWKRFNRSSIKATGYNQSKSRPSRVVNCTRA
jgi:hypothetical protein